jgi:hypothetical protein
MEDLSQSALVSKLSRNVPMMNEYIDRRALTGATCRIVRKTARGGLPTDVVDVLRVNVTKDRALWSFSATTANAFK